MIKFLLIPWIIFWTVAWEIFNALDQMFIIDEEACAQPLEEWPIWRRVWSHTLTFCFLQSMTGFGGKRIE